MESEIGASDILVANPSFSSHQFGPRLRGFKLCYVQGFSTFGLLDLKFDHFVAVSDFVAGFVRPFGVAARVIPAFVDHDSLPPALDWAQRPANVVLPYRKGLPEVWEPSFARVREICAQRAPEIQFADALPDGGTPHAQFLQRIAAMRHLLVLSAAEGFGLVPLEAMALGTLVCGYDGFGGRQYMRPDENCAVGAYPHVEIVAERLIAAVREPQRSARMAQHARETAAHYSYAAFRSAWIEEFKRVLG
jgi:glycosyltransferase involved in cell wall biosynthesis